MFFILFFHYCIFASEKNSLIFRFSIKKANFARYNKKNIKLYIFVKTTEKTRRWF